MSLCVYWFRAWQSTHMRRLQSFLCAKKMGTLYRLVLEQIQLCSRYVPSCLHTSVYSAGDKWYYLVLDNWASGFNKVMLCVTRCEGGKMGSSNKSENLSNKTKIYGSLAPGAEGVPDPSYSLSGMLLVPIARKLPNSHYNVNHAAPCDLQKVLINDLKEHSSTQVSHNDKVPSTT